MTTLSLNIDARGAQKGAKDFKGATDRVKTSAMQADSAVDQMGASVAKTGKSMTGRNSFIFQNTANQLGDIAVQASMGTNMFRVLGMQLPQIAGGFALLGGSIGIIAPVLGIIAAIGFPLIAMFMALKGSVKSTAEELDQASVAMGDFDDMLKLSFTPLEKIDDKFGQFSSRVQELSRATLQLNMVRVAAELGDFAESLQEVMDPSVFQSIMNLDFKSAIGFDDLDDQLLALQDTFKITELESMKLAFAIQETQRAITTPARAESFVELAEVIGDLIPASTEASVKLAKLQKEVAEGALTAFEFLAAIDAMNNGMTTTQHNAGNAETAIKQMMKEFDESLKRTRQRMKPLQDAADMVGNSFERAFMSAVDGSMSAKDAFRSMAVNIISELYRIFVVKKITGFISSFIADPAMFAGLGGGGTVTRPMIRPDRFEGGGYTGNGPRSGGLDGRGGFMAMLHPNETVVDHSRGNSGGEVVVNQTINVTTGVQQTVRTEIQTLLPQIAEASKAAVLDARRRGGSFANAF